MSQHFPAPGSMFEAQQRLVDLRTEAQIIDAQLSQPVRCDREGRPLSAKAYEAWRNRAVFAFKMKKAEITFLEGWLEMKTRKARQVLVEQTFEVRKNDPYTLLAGLYRWVRGKIREEAMILDEAERALIDSVQLYLTDHIEAVGGE